MANLGTKIPMGLLASGNFRDKQHLLPGNSEFKYTKPEPIPTNLKNADACMRSENHIPTTVGENTREGKSTARERLGMVLELLYRRPGFVSGRLKRHVIKVESQEPQSPEDAEFIVHFSDGASVGLRGVIHDGKNVRAYRKRYKRESLKIVHVVVDVCKKVIQNAMEVLGQIAWHGNSIFGAMVRRHRKPRQGQDGNAPSQYRFMMRSAQAGSH